MKPIEYTYPCVTPCQYKGRVWEPGEVFATNDPADIPPHHFEGGVNPKDTEALAALVASRGAPATPPNEPSDASKGGDPGDAPKGGKDAQPKGGK